MSQRAGLIGSGMEKVDVFLVKNGVFGVKFVTFCCLNVQCFCFLCDANVERIV